MWESVRTVWRYRGPSWKDGRPVAAFDFDSTLHAYKRSGPDAALTLAFLRALNVDADWNIVIFTNRSTAAATGLSALKGYVASLEQEEGGSCDVYASTARDHYRKPQTGMWELFCKDRGVASLPPGSFFCGDAAGRPSDFSASDINFARNVGIRFVTPEEVFGAANVLARKSKEESLVSLGVKALEIRMEMAQNSAGPRMVDAALAAVADCDVVLMVGSPASGKSTFAARLAAERGFGVASQDVQGTYARCRDHALALRREGKRVVIDNTHRSQSVRAQYLAALNPARSAIVWIKTDKVLCHHLDGLRCDSDPDGQLLPRPVIPGFWRNFEEPTPAEADELVELEFAFAPDTPPEVLEKRYYP